MTINKETILVIRKENPNLDLEIRGILMSRAQEGATIEQIREDFLKITGLKFPIYDGIVEYLLTIPCVSAFCSENGTQIFNIRPSNKTKHLHELIVQQKPNDFFHPGTKSLMYSHQPFRSNYNNKNDKPLSWRNQNSVSSYNGKKYSEQPKMGVEPLKPIKTDENRCYTDNCQYLYNRLYNPRFNSNNLFAKDINNSVNKLSNNLTYTTLMKHNQEHHMKSQRNNNVENGSNQQSGSWESGLNKPYGEYSSNGTGSSSRPSLSSLTRIIRMRESSDSLYSASTENDAQLLDFPLMGDDFFLYFARMELKCKFKTNQKVLQSGLCMSGQTISSAIKQVQQLGISSKRIIINVGSVDVMKGRSLVQIEHNYRQLINLMLRKGMLPILTTLAPLANYAHQTEIKEKLERLNEFIKREAGFLQVIDIWSCLVNDKRQTLFDCFQNEPRNVTGTTEPYVFWNNIGRQRVLQMIEAHIEY